MLFEISIFCVILFAIGYWATLFIMGRREDVLHGEFVEAEPELMPAAAGAPMPRVVAPPARVAQLKPPPTKPIEITPMEIKPMEIKPAPAPPAAIPVPAPIAQPNAVPMPAVVAATVPPPVVAKAPASTDSLQSLLVSIKQELKNAAQI